MNIKTNASNYSSPKVEKLHSNKSNKDYNENINFD
jgi:hypothetical protein